MLDELRQLGKNLHAQRYSGLRSRAWRTALYHSMERQLQNSAEKGRLTLTFEIIYGHAFKPAPRIKMQPKTTLSLEQMQSALRQSSVKTKK
jgi:malonyl-CoA O-methyltransferase